MTTYIIDRGSWDDRGAGVFVLCPQCDVKRYLDHQIDDQGNVSPSVVCDCGFHATIRLEGWDPTEPRKPQEPRKGREE